MQITKRDGGVIGGLALFGLIYNALVEDFERRGWAMGYTAFLVVLGTLFTLAGAGLLIGWRNAAKVLACFGASGFPMIVGSVGRYVREREQDQRNGRGVNLEIIRYAENAEKSQRVLYAPDGQSGR